MTKCVGQVTRSKVRESIIVKRPKDIIAYQQHMGGDDYRYHQMFALMESNYNMSSVGICRSNRKVFDSKQLLLDKL